MAGLSKVRFIYRSMVTLYLDFSLDWSQKNYSLEVMYTFNLCFLFGEILWRYSKAREMRIKERNICVVYLKKNWVEFFFVNHLRLLLLYVSWLRKRIILFPHNNVHVMYYSYGNLKCAPIVLWCCDVLPSH